MLKRPPVICDSVTRLGAGARDAVVLAGSHCGNYAAHLAAKAGVRAVILCDAGIGRERAGVVGLQYLEELGIAAATFSHRSARIGDGEDARRRGLISFANSRAAAFGIAIGMAAQEATDLLDLRAERWDARLRDEIECRVLPPSPKPEERVVVLLDSVSLAEPEDRGQIIVTGSHGGLLGGRPETASKVDVFAALYNDADVGIDGAGLTRLPALDARGIAAGTVSAWSARIGDGRSTYEDGFISHLNETARRCGAEIGMSARDFVNAMQAADKKGMGS